LRDEEEQQDASSAPSATPEDAIELTATWMHHSTYSYEDSWHEENVMQSSQDKTIQCAEAQDEEMQEMKECADNESRWQP